MVVLPVVKLATLALKTACKPIANRLKKEAGYHPKFRNFIIAIAQANHRLTTRVQRRIYGRDTGVAIRPLNEERAVQAAADLLGELFVFSVAGAAIIFEVQRSSRSEARKEELRKQELQSISMRNEELAREIQLLALKIEELEQHARGRGLLGTLNIRHTEASVDRKSN
ncbi:optic atrophy 3 protein homolog [Cajanus cajan]|uniref:Optic atrophy 3 protein isogeny n=1 Tax=Cajanus cajan TaxID=3821 RepID=A0A151SVH7_CAJCA|nr:optic atrophy 3 protein homolog [Cajanus cajan]KYP58778.1 Optic atrophy 3 protein isogeny [Cajanus cajan]